MGQYAVDKGIKSEVKLMAVVRAQFYWRSNALSEKNAILLERGHVAMWIGCFFTLKVTL